MAPLRQPLASAGEAEASASVVTARMANAVFMMRLLQMEFASSTAGRVQKFPRREQKKGPRSARIADARSHRSLLQGTRVTTATKQPAHGNSPEGRKKAQAAATN